MRVLIAIISFQGDAENGNHDKIRQTWGKDVATAGADLRFFLGRRDGQYRPQADEVLIPWQKDGTRTCAHPYWHAEPGCGCVEYWQVLYRGMMDWSLANGYDFAFFAENDTFIVPRKLMKTEFEQYDLSGWLMYTHADKPDQFYPEPGGYFLSKKAMEIVSATTPNHLHFENLVIDVLKPRGGIKSLDHFWNEAMWHYRAQESNPQRVSSWRYDPVIRDGYPAGSQWQYEMYSKHGGDQ